MNNNKIITIVPALPPSVNGLGDYAYHLAGKMKADYHLDSLFLTMKKADEGIQNGLYQDCIDDKNAEVLFEKLCKYNSTYLIVHYVGYAYSQRGCPYWLIKGLTKWKKKNPQCKLITIFHELYANGRIWESAFWLSPLQKNLAFRLLSLSDYAITTGEVTYRIANTVKQDVLVMPVISNVGEPSELDEFESREDVCVVFGSAHKRSEVLEASSAKVGEWVEKLKISKIIEIGPVRQSKSSISGVEIRQEGILGAEAISNILRKSKYGLLQYPYALFSKSGIFAAYASHGIVPIVFGDHAMNYECDGLKSGVHFMNDDFSQLEFGTISKNVFYWYQDHNLSKLAEMVSKLVMANIDSKV